MSDTISTPDFTKYGNMIQSPLHNHYSNSINGLTTIENNSLIADCGGSTVSELKSVLNETIESILHAITVAADIILTPVTCVLNKLGINVPPNLMSNLANYMRGLNDGGIIGACSKAISSAAKTTGGDICDLIDKLKDTLNAILGPLKPILDLLKSILSGIKSLFDQVGKILGWVASIINCVPGAKDNINIPSALSYVNPIASDIAKTVQQNVTDKIPLNVLGISKNKIEQHLNFSSMMSSYDSQLDLNMKSFFDHVDKSNNILMI